MYRMWMRRAKLKSVETKTKFHCLIHHSYHAAPSQSPSEHPRHQESPKGLTHLKTYHRHLLHYLRCHHPYKAAVQVHCHQFEVSLLYLRFLNHCLLFKKYGDKCR